jgi:hypothetical protein
VPEIALNGNIFFLLAEIGEPPLLFYRKKADPHPPFHTPPKKCHTPPISHYAPPLLQTIDERAKPACTGRLLGIMHLALATNQQHATRFIIHKLAEEQKPYEIC